MNKTDHILSRAVAGPYYRQHGGFLLFGFFLLFGTQPSFIDAVQFHYAIIKSILTSPGFFIIAASAWIIYALKTVHFFYSNLQKNAFQFLFLLNALPFKKRLASLLRLQISFFMPIWIYFIFVVFIAIKEGYYSGLLLVTLTLILLCVISVLFYNYSLKKGRFLLFSTISKAFFRPWPRNLFSFLIRFIFREQFFALAIIKTLSFFSLYALARLEANVYEDRILWLIYITTLVGHSMLIYKNHQFIESKLRFYRNLPLRPFQTLLTLFFIYFLLLLPELWALKAVAVNQHQLIDFTCIVATGPAMLLLMHCLLYTGDMKMEGYLQLLFGIWIVSIFFSLSANRWLLPLICMAMSCIIFYMSYYRYEKNAEAEALE